MMLTSGELALILQTKSLDMSTAILGTSSSAVDTSSSTVTSVTDQPVASIGSIAVVSSDSRLSHEEQFSCRWNQCTAVFQALEDLVSHVNDLHLKAEVDEVYRCHWEGCPRNGKGFNARYKALIHVRTHTNEKPHACYFCGKHFSRLESLKIHKRTHTGEKPYACPYEGCSKAYSNSSDRFKHVLTHRVDRPYSCKMPGCNKRYTDPSSLRKHIRAHGHHFITTADSSSDEQAIALSQHTATSSTEVTNIKLPGTILSPIIQDGHSGGVAKMPQLPYVVAGLPALINGNFYMPNLISNTLLPLAGIPMSVNCSKIPEPDRKALTDVSGLTIDESSSSSPAGVL